MSKTNPARCIMPDAEAALIEARIEKILAAKAAAKAAEAAVQAAQANLAQTCRDGICAVTGPNGAGKSTLLGAIELALFADGARDLAPALGPFAERMEIELVFEHDGEEYRVRRA